MTYISEDEVYFDFLNEIPIPNENDKEWVSKLEQEKSCRDCEYFTNEVILPCAVNTEKVYHPDDYSEYSLNED